MTGVHFIGHFTILVINGRLIRHQFGLHRVTKDHTLYYPANGHQFRRVSRFTRNASGP